MILCVLWSIQSRFCSLRTRINWNTTACLSVWEWFWLGNIHHVYIHAAIRKWSKQKTGLLPALLCDCENTRCMAKKVEFIMTEMYPATSPKMYCACIDYRDPCSVGQICTRTAYKEWTLHILHIYYFLLSVLSQSGSSEACPGVSSCNMKRRRARAWQRRAGVSSFWSGSVYGGT